MHFNSNLLTCLAALGRLSSVLAAPASPDLDELLDPRQISLDENYLFDSAFRTDGSAFANESLRLRVYADDGAAATTLPISIPTAPVSLPTVPVSIRTTPVSLPTVPVSIRTTPISISIRTTSIAIPTTTLTPPPPPRTCTTPEQDECLRGSAPSPILCTYLAQALARSPGVLVPGNGNSVCLAELVRGGGAAGSASYCCAHTSRRVAGLTYGDLLLPTIQLTGQCVAPRAERGHIKQLSLVRRNACVNFCLDNKPTGCT